LDHSTTAQIAGDNARKSNIKRALGYFFAFVCLVWVFHDVHPQKLLSAIRIANWWFVILAVFFDVLTYVLQGLRWTLLLNPVGRLRPVKAMQAIYVGLFANEILPLRFGEVVRAFLAARWLKARIGRVVPSMVIERFLDALWLVVGIGLVAIFVPLPGNLIHAGDALGAVVLAATGLFVWLVLRKERELEHGNAVAGRSEPGLKHGMARFIANVASGLRQIGLSENLYLAAILSAAMLMCQGLAIWFIMLACGLRLGIAAGAVVLLVVRLGTAIPNAPANVGSFQFFTVLALGLFGVNKTVAAAFSIVGFAILTIPLWAIGLLSLAATGMSFGTLRTRIATEALQANGDATTKCTDEVHC
jgi:glycosyltransferase 2 family protein